MDTLNNLAISPTGFVFDPATGATYSVNATGRAVLEGIRDGLGLEALVAHLSERFQVGQADLRRDVLEYARVLREQQLVPASFELES